MTTAHRADPIPPVPPPTRHELAFMIWLAVLPTLTVLNMLLEDRLRALPTVPRTFVLATLAVPIVVYGVIPQLHRARGHLLSRRRSRLATTTTTAPAGRHGESSP